MALRPSTKNTPKPTKPKIAKKASKPAKNSKISRTVKPRAAPTKPEPLKLGLTDFTRALKDAVERSATEEIEVSFGGSAPLIRFRPASKYEDDVLEVPDDKRITIAQLRRMPNSYRALVIVGMVFVVSSGEHKVLMDRHPKFPKSVVDLHMKEYRRLARTTAQRIADKHARKASMGTREIMDFLELAAANQEIHNEEVIKRNDEIARQNNEIIELLAEVMDKGIITPELKAAVVRWQTREKTEIAKARLSERQRLATENDLEIYEVGTN